MVFAQESKDLECMFKKLYKQFEKYGMQIDILKTEPLVINSDDKHEINI